MTDLEILEKVAMTTDKPEVRAKVNKVIAMVKAQQARQDGYRARGGFGDNVIIKVQRASAK